MSDIFSQEYQPSSQTTSSEGNIIKLEGQPSTKQIIEDIVSETKKYGVTKPTRDIIKAKRIYDHGS